MRLVTSVVVAALLFAGTASAAAPAIGSTPRDHVAVDHATPVLHGGGWLESPNFGGWVLTSELIPDEGLNSEVANDFVLTGDGPVTVSRIRWWGGYFDFNPAVITNLVVNTIAGATGVDRGARPQAPGGPAIPVRFALDPGVPNPFNPRTTIRYDVPHAGAVVSMDIFDVDGRLVRTLVRGAVAAGTYEVTWDGRNGGGGMMPSGVYFSRLSASGFSETQKLVLAK